MSRMTYQQFQECFCPLMEIEFAESGADREHDHDPERTAEKRYQEYLEGKSLKQRLLDHFLDFQYEFDPEEMETVDSILKQQDEDLSHVSVVDIKLLLRIVTSEYLFTELSFMKPKDITNPFG